MNLMSYVMFLLIAFSIHFSQESNSFRVFGTITSTDDNSPIPNANVYLSGTLWGSATDENGHFKIDNISNGEYEIVVSMIGYESISKIISLGSRNELKIDFQLIPISYDLETIKILTEKPDQWIDDLDFFKELFLGNSDFADNCVLENEVYLEFSRQNESTFLASSKIPLSLTNNALGYKIEFVLINFSFNIKNSHLRYLIRPYFKELKTDNDELLLEWENNRSKAYVGSKQHFLECLFHADFLDNGYQIWLTSYPYEDLVTRDIEVKESERILRPIKGSLKKSLRFPGYLKVVHNWSAPSWLYLSAGDTEIDQYGLSSDIIPFETHGFWSRLGMANLLPKNYVMRKK